MTRGTRTAERRWRNRPIVRERDRRGARWSWWLAGVMALAAAPVGFYLVEQNRCLTLSYEVSALRAEHARLLEAERRLRVSRAALESLDRIEGWATEEHGLVFPAAGQVVVLVPSRPPSRALLARQSAPRGSLR